MSSSLPPVSLAGGSALLVLLQIEDHQLTFLFLHIPCSSSATYLADVLELVIRKKALPVDPSLGARSTWVLCLADLSFILPLDRTVESLMGVTDLALVRRTWAESHGIKGGNERGGDPNGPSTV